MCHLQVLSEGRVLNEGGVKKVKGRVKYFLFLWLVFVDFRVCKNDPKAQESLGCGWFLLFFMIFHGVEAPAKLRKNVCFP